MLLSMFRCTEIPEHIVFRLVFDGLGDSGRDGSTRGGRLQVPMSASRECVRHLLHGSFASNVGVSDTTLYYFQ